MTKIFFDYDLHEIWDLEIGAFLGQLDQLGQLDIKEVSRRYRRFAADERRFKSAKSLLKSAISARKNSRNLLEIISG